VPAGGPLRFDRGLADGGCRIAVWMRRDGAANALTTVSHQQGQPPVWYVDCEACGGESLMFMYDYALREHTECARHMAAMPAWRASQPKSGHADSDADIRRWIEETGAAGVVAVRSRARNGSGRPAWRVDCAVCDLSLDVDSREQLAAHLGGPRHAMRLAEALPAAEAGVAPRNTPSGSGSVSDRGTACAICDTELHSTAALRQHKTTEKHGANAAVLAKPASGAAPSSRRDHRTIDAWIRHIPGADVFKVVAVLDRDYHGQRYWSVVCTECETEPFEVFHSSGLQRHLDSAHTERWQCKECDIVLTSAGAVRVHEATEKHEANVAVLAKPASGAAPSPHNDHHTIDAWIRHIPGADVFKVTEVLDRDSRGQRRWSVACALCNTAPAFEVFHTSGLQRHLESKLHAANVNTADLFTVIPGKHKRGPDGPDYSSVFCAVCKTHFDIGGGHPTVGWHLGGEAHQRKFALLENRAVSATHVNAVPVKVAVKVRSAAEAPTVPVRNVDQWIGASGCPYFEVRAGPASPSAAQCWEVECTLCDKVLKVSGASGLKNHAKSAKHVAAARAHRALRLVGGVPRSSKRPREDAATDDGSSAPSREDDAPATPTGLFAVESVPYPLEATLLRQWDETAARCLNELPFSDEFDTVREGLVECRTCRGRLALPVDLDDALRCLVAHACPGEEDCLDGVLAVEPTDFEGPRGLVRFADRADYQQSRRLDPAAHAVARRPMLPPRDTAAGRDCVARIAQLALRRALGSAPLASLAPSEFLT
jgi:hypothetical protein